MTEEKKSLLLKLSATLVGKTVRELPDLSPYSIRRVSVDGRPCLVTHDVKPERINVRVDAYDMILSVESLG